MKKLLSTLLLALITIAGWAQKEVVWENPSAFTGSGNIEFDITKMELKETETVMHFRVKFIPNYWIRFAKESFLKTPDGKEYAVVSGKKTSEAESDVELDSLFWMPESGLADLVLHFKPVPTDTKEIDFCASGGHSLKPRFRKFRRALLHCRAAAQPGRAKPQSC